MTIKCFWIIPKFLYSCSFHFQNSMLKPGGEIQIFQCPPSVPDCGNRGRSRSYVPPGGPYARRLAHGTLLRLQPGEWLWDGEPEAAYRVTQRLRPESGTAMVWLSETVHQVEPVLTGTRKSCWIWVGVGFYGNYIHWLSLTTYQYLLSIFNHDLI